MPAACLLQTPGDPKEHNGLKDLRRYGGFVLLNIIGCKGLPVNNKLADIPDAYVAVSSGVESVKTSVVNNSSSPYFDETLLLLVDDPEVPISVDVFDKEMFSKDEFLVRHPACCWHACACAARDDGVYTRHVAAWRRLSSALHYPFCPHAGVMQDHASAGASGQHPARPAGNMEADGYESGGQCEGLRYPDDAVRVLRTA